MKSVNDGGKRFYLVDGDILPEAILKTALVNEMLAKGEVTKVSEAVEKVGLSRSAYYKYKDGVLPFRETGRSNIVSVSLMLEHHPGILSRVLNTVAAMEGNILTINQSVPEKGLAPVAFVLDRSRMSVDLPRLLAELRQLTGVRSAQLVGSEEE
ncbi:chorismate mutase [Heliobacterium gestii]|nr:chorismate mutase [Heliomicrobium gestii]